MLPDNDPAVSAAQAPDDPWLSLAGAHSAEALCQAWLVILCGQAGRVASGLLLLEDGSGSYAPAAYWPQDKDPSYLRDLALEALNTRQAVSRRDGEGICFGYPLLDGEALHGVVLLDLREADEAALTQVRRQLHWGAGWLADLFSRRAVQAQAERLAHSTELFDLALLALAEADFSKTTLALANRLAQRFACHQVVFGVEKGKAMRVQAMSHSAWFEEKANRVDLAAQAMNEAFDQHARIVLPQEGAGASLITATCRRYLDDSGSTALCAQPVTAGQHLLGVWLLERDEPFSTAELELLDTLALILGPILELRQNADESLFSHVRRSWRRVLSRLGDSTHPGYKLLVAGFALLLLLLAVYPADYRVTAQAVVEGETQRVAVAPFDGYVHTAPKRAGDVVRAGEVLASLEDKELRLEKLRWEAELEVALRKEQEAMAKGERVDLRLAAAQANQARAQLDLAREKLARIDVVAPFDGVVVRGDLSQQLGSPVEQGKLLFEIAPLRAWRVILKVDERDIADVRAGQKGELLLTALPGQRFPVRVDKVTPVAVAEEGRNYFRVEAAVARADALAKLRPNMEGVAKVEAGSQSLLWIWTHRLSDWLRLTLWKWWP